MLNWFDQNVGTGNCTDDTSSHIRNLDSDLRAYIFETLTNKKFENYQICCFYRSLYKTCPPDDIKASYAPHNDATIWFTFVLNNLSTLTYAEQNYAATNNIPVYDCDK